ncbi:Phloem protein [Parasponia andersonii]|uniref:Phloem protein n=1 Tax=Parasponia andersonii TaxID=3476 RepID=A0A2P5CAE8_PARAD|nr:Phloem protein [Parasponia andersonii]
MGAGFSASKADEDGSEEKPRLGDIPENCMAMVLMYLDPPDVCKYARLNRAFRAASSADFIWESKLPSNYLYVMDRVFENSTMGDKLGKREIYARLCRRKMFDNGTREFWVDKSRGNSFLSISSKALRITGIDDRRYWNFISTEESRFQTVAYLQQTWWFEVEGEFEFRFPAGNYSVYIRLQLGRSSKRLGRRVCNYDHVHGWDIKPVKFQLTTFDGQHDVSQCFLENPGNWVNYHVGSFVVENPNSLMKIKFSVTQIDCTHTKGGVCVDSVLVRPGSVG